MSEETGNYSVLSAIQPFLVKRHNENDSYVLIIVVITHFHPRSKNVPYFENQNLQVQKNKYTENIKYSQAY